MYAVRRSSKCTQWKFRTWLTHCCDSLFHSIVWGASNHATRPPEDRRTALAVSAPDCSSTGSNFRSPCVSDSTTSLSRLHGRCSRRHSPRLEHTPFTLVRFNPRFCLCGSTSIFVGGRMRLSSGRSSGRFTFWLRSILLLYSLRGTFSVSCGSNALCCWFLERFHSVSGSWITITMAC